ncbi:hypothetical protein [Myroides sp. N17-2]|uniref:hypothetical protein n=1 Tax=Myroides sp. N17-2 TaxID=2030799 RepID=UPI000EFB8FB0|nr:hypothetical protein [Myroides sp. N17-2]
MRKNLLFILLVLVWVSCKPKQILETTSSSSLLHVANREYGYSPYNPINVGGVKQNRGPQNQIEYLKDLTDLEGNSLSFYRVGSCCHFDTPNGLFNGRGVLDIYAVYVKGKTDTVRLYLNLYDEGKLYAPRGFKFKM